MEKAKSFYEKGLSFLEADKPNPKKAVNFFIKAWKRFESLTAWDDAYKTLDKIAECYHKILKKPRQALIYIERKHDLKNKNKDFEGVVMADIEMARMFAEYKNGRDEALEFYKRAWKESKKHKVKESINDLIKKETADVLKLIEKSEEFIQKYIKEHYK
ncbi:MAG: hypothetical protein ACTSYZ_12030 [Candidatus Helarchaeota archaeon]